MIDVSYTLQGINFQWDAGKAANNQIKHGIAFETACSAFFDPFLVSLDDEFIDGGMRHTTIGIPSDWQFLYAVYVWRGDAIRIISARLAANHEKKRYETQ
ncbi:MAG: BrnT family toxin [Chloroflexi bacterium]|nr:BrnT family toxin [Chloroflexota bacterium]